MSAADPTPLGGVLNVDKPAGWTSHDVVARVRRLAGLRQVGHAGTLDPMATGVLVLCLGRATRLLEYLTGQPKSYLAEVTLGVVTDTYDAEGEIVSRFSDWHALADRAAPQRPGEADNAPALTADQIERALEAFRGEIMQRPPAFSALKRDGVPLYRRARAGERVEVEPRPATIYELTLLHLEGATLRLHVRCGAGVYVRSIAHDLGQALGCGAHLSALRRTAVGAFSVENAVALESLTEAGALAAAVQPADAAVAHLPAVALNAAEVSRLLHGQAVAAAAPLQAGPARAYDPQGRFLGIVAGDAAARVWRPSKILANQEPP
ncbi:MAG TPA: tRNA pseudouridine(55) synthase TruB [Anaerolineae bacterium]|nr:tRNA pseudouridine(55) synthase TruB [Anaerolineae bacterium]HNU03065.1 tRNA pseudouridine(55) synthase TruB [Anaerolineae bacterium]